MQEKERTAIDWSPSIQTNILLLHTCFVWFCSFTYPLTNVRGAGKKLIIASEGAFRREGVYNERCFESKLKGCTNILGMIWRDVKRYWLAQIQLPSWNE